MNTPARWSGSALAAGAIGYGGWRARALTGDGALAATAVGATVLARGGWPAAAALVVFFVTSSALSRFKAREKARRGVLVQAKGGRRDAWQVLANGGAAAACVGLAGRRGAGGYLGALATAGADTWATELGLLAARRPRSILSLRPVPPGTSGGVTPEGTLASLAGAATAGAAWTAMEWLQSGHRPGDAVRGIVRTALAGTAGALIDSLLGATVQGAYWCPRCHEPTETRFHARCGEAASLVRGVPWITNDVVNALATAAGALIGVALNAKSAPRVEDSPPAGGASAAVWEREGRR